MFGLTGKRRPGRKPLRTEGPATGGQSPPPSPDSLIFAEDTLCLPTPIPYPITNRHRPTITACLLIRLSRRAAPA